MSGTGDPTALVLAVTGETVILVVIGVLVVVALIVEWRRDRSGALDDPGGMMGVGKSGRGRRD